MTIFLPLLSLLVMVIILWPKKKKRKGSPEWFHDEARKNADYFNKK